MGRSTLNISLAGMALCLHATAACSAMHECGVARTSAPAQPHEEADAPFVHVHGPEWSGAFVVESELDQETGFTTLRLVGRMSAPASRDTTCDADPSRNGEPADWPAKITLVYDPGRFHIQHSDGLVAVRGVGEERASLLKAEPIGPTTALWSVPARPAMPTIEVWNPDHAPGAGATAPLGPVHVAALFQFLSPEPLIAGMQRSCDPTLDACENSASRMCPDGVDDFEYSCNQETGAATCKYTCKSDAGDPTPGPE